MIRILYLFNSKTLRNTEDVIAFTNGRQEFEIIQYQGVRDIEEIYSSFIKIK